MIQFFTKKLVLIAAVFALLGTISCQKEINESIDGTADNTTPPTRTVDLTTRINSSVTGFVTDENNAAVNGATVRFEVQQQQLINTVIFNSTISL